MPGFQRDPDDRAALLVPLLLSHRLRPCRGSRAFEEVRQFLADRELGFVGSYPAVGVGKGIARSGAGPEPVGSPDLCLDLLAGRAASGQRALASPEVVVADLDSQAVDAVKPRWAGQHDTEAESLVVACCPWLDPNPEPRRQFGAPTVLLDTGERRGGLVGLA